MFKRSLRTKLLSLTKDYPVVTIIGPRQSGKTTLVKTAFPDKPYVNLEAPDVRLAALDDPRLFLEKYKNGAILDEIQRTPELLSYIQVLVDEVDKKGLFILTGSHQMELHESISQSLAGRTALLTLFPMSMKELSDEHIAFSLDEILLKGGYPRIYKDNLDPTDTYRNYFQTYVERDLRQLINVKDLVQFERFVKLIAGRVAKELSLNEIGNAIGISSHTVKEWLSILEASYIIFRLQPYFENFGKRMIKSPKLYFVDVGLASYLLGIQDLNQMGRDPLRGHLVENLVVVELMKAKLNQGRDPELYYYRDVQKHEVDVIHKQGHLLIPIEIKSSKTFHSDFTKEIEFFQNLTQERSPKGYLIYAGDIDQHIRSVELLNFKDASMAVLTKHESV